MSFYDTKRAPSVPPSYLSRSPPGSPEMIRAPYDTYRTPYEHELGDISGRTGYRPRRVDDLRNEHQAWKYGADSYFRQRSPPSSSFDKIYRMFCCGSRVGCAVYVIAVLLLLTGLAVAFALIMRHHDTSQSATTIGQLSSPGPTSTLTTVSTFYSSPPSTVTATTTATGTATSISGSTFTESTTVVTTVLSTLITDSFVSVSIATVTPLQASAITATSMVTITSLSTTTTPTTQSTTVTLRTSNTDEGNNVTINQTLNAAQLEPPDQTVSTVTMTTTDSPTSTPMVTASVATSGS